MAAPAQNLQTMTTAIEACGVLDNNPNLYEGSTAAERILADIFDDEFETCMDKSFKDLDQDWSTYAALTQSHGQIRLRPATKKNIRALVQWTRDEIRQNRNPSQSLFQVDNAPAILKRYHTHEQWLNKATDKAKTAKPKQFTEKTKWMDWRDSFVNFLRTQPGRTGIPLSYVVRDNEGPIQRTNVEFLDNYVDLAPLNGVAFASNASEVHTFLVNFITENPTAENKILPYADLNNGRRDYQALKDHYEGVGATAKAIVKSEDDLQNLFYAGEKKPHMWWEEFEMRLTVAFATIDKHEGRQVHSDESKLRMLNKKIKCDFLEIVRTGIELDMTRLPMTMTYEIALANYRNAVNRKFPGDGETRRSARRINQVGSQRGRGRGRGGRHFNRDGRGRGRGFDHSGRGRGDFNKRGRSDAWFVTCNDGTRLEVHPAYSFSDAVWNKIPQETRSRLMDQRREYKRTRSVAQSDSSYRCNQYRGNYYNDDDQRSQYSTFSSGPPSTNNRNQSESATHISEITTNNGDGGGSIMGGRNEQASICTRNANNRNNENYRQASQVKTKRRIGSATRDGSNEPVENTRGSNEADTNADTCCLGKNFIPLTYTNRTADVYPYDDSYKPMVNIPIVTGATAYDHPNGTTYILIFHESLYYGTKLSHSLINPNQLRHHAVDFWDNPYVENHILSIQPTDDLIIPL